MSLDTKSDQEIIQQSEEALNSRSFDTKVTSGSEESGLNESGMEQFSAPRGVPQSTYGRTGQTGGGENDQFIPVEEGGDERTGGQMSNTLEGPAGDKDEQREASAKEIGTGSVSLRGDAIDARSVNDEVIGDLRGANTKEPEFISQDANPYDVDAQ